MPLIITIFSIVIIKILLFGFFKKKSWYQNYSKLLQDIGILISIAAVIYSYMQTDISIKYAKLAIDQAEESSKQSDEIARKTISLLDSISKSSSGLKGNLDSISFTIKTIDKYLISLSQNISNINTFSDEQVSNLKAINLAIQTQAKLLNEQNERTIIESLRRPVLKLIYDCVPSLDEIGNESLGIYLVNKGNIKAKVILEEFISAHGIISGGEFELSENSKYRMGYLTKGALQNPELRKVTFKAQYSSENGYSNYIEITNMECE